MPTSKRKGTCSGCPFRKRAAPGWLGSSGPAQFLVATISSAMGGTEADAMPCHMDIDYTDEDWAETQLPDAAHCVGSLQFLNNFMLAPRDPDYYAATNEVGRSTKVFATPQEFYDHHSTHDWGDDAPFSIQHEDQMLERLENAQYIVLRPEEPDEQAEG